MLRHVTEEANGLGQVETPHRLGDTVGEPAVRPGVNERHIRRLGALAEKVNRFEEPG